MTVEEAVLARHSVRAYLDKQIEESVAKDLAHYIDKCNAISGLNIQLVLNEPKAFSGIMAHYGKFSGVTSYIAMIGDKSADLDEKLGYYGEKIVLQSQMLGLNTCWVALTYKKVKTALKIGKNQRLRAVIALGYGKTQGVSRKSKPIERVCNFSADLPDWFIGGVKSALLAPTAVNQQKFYFESADGKVTAKAGVGFYSKVDLGIVKCHFEIGANREVKFN